MAERICRMPAFDGRSGLCGKPANRVLRSDERGRIFVCIFHAAAELKARAKGPKRRGRGVGGSGGGGEATTSGGGAGGGWRGANKKYAPPVRGYAEYILLLLFVISISLGMGLFVYGPQMMGAVENVADPIDGG